MPIVTALLSFLSRKVGDILQAVFGWSITGLFGRLPRSKQIGLSFVMLLAMMWPILVVGIAAPRVAAFMLAFLPLHEWASDRTLRFVWVVCAVVVPLAVGLLTRWIAPDRATRGSIWKTILGGYRLTLGFAASFLITLCTVPLLKLAALGRGHKDEHVYMLVREKRYPHLVRQLRDTVGQVGIEATIQKPPTVMALASRVMKWFAHGSLDPIVPDDPKMLSASGLEMYLYPADLLLRGESAKVALVRSAILRWLPLDSAHLCKDPHAQEIEDELQRMWEVVERHDDPSEIGVTGRQRMLEIAGTLSKSDVPYEDWVLLYTNLRRLERALCGGPRLLDGDTSPQVTKEVKAMAHLHAPSERSTAELVKDALDEGRELVKLEVALAKDELRIEVAKAKASAIAFAIAGASAIIGVSLLLVALALVISLSAVPALIIGLVALVVAGIVGVVGYKAMPKKPLDATRKRLETDVHLLKERIA